MNGLSITLSWVLVHSLWMAAVVWIGISIAEVFIKKSSQRRIVKATGVATFYMALVIGFIMELPHVSEGTTEWMLFEEALFFQTELGLVDQFKLFINQSSSVITALWLVGTLLGVIRMAKQKQDLNQIQRYATRTRDKELKQRLQALSQQLGIDRFVTLVESEMISSPMTAGFLKPIIYIPTGLSTGLTYDEIDAILLHELSHIKRNDYLLNWLLVITETLFFFNPIVLHLVKQLRREMEYTCDDEVLNEQNEISYARTLIKLEEFNLNNKLSLQAKNNNSEFSKRINRMIKQQKPVMHQKLVITSLLAITLVLSSAFTSKTLKQDENPKPVSIAVESLQEEQDTLRFSKREEMVAKIKSMTEDDFKGVIIMLNDKEIKVIKDADNALKKADEMMKEINSELIKDGLLNANRQKMTLMFQYSDLLNGKANLGDKYEKYKAIFNRYFPVYDSFATTRVFRYKQ